MFFLLILIIPSVFIGLLGRKRAFGFWGFFFLSLIISPPITFIILLLSRPDKYHREKMKSRA